MDTTTLKLDFGPEWYGPKHGTALVMVRMHRCVVCEQPIVSVALRDQLPVKKKQHLMVYAEPTSGEIVRSECSFGVKMVNGNYVCETCHKDGKLNVTCALCGQTRKSSELQETIGDPPEYLCLPCYKTVPAQVWAMKVDELMDSHQYDFDG